MSDYTMRIARLQEAMQAEKAVLTILAGTDQMRYFSGWKEGGHERFVGLLIPSHGEPAFVVPAMNTPQARNNPGGITHILGWEDARGWQPTVLETLSGWGIKMESGVAFVDDELHSAHLLGFQRLFPNWQWKAAGPLLAMLRQIKTEVEIAAMQRAADMIDAVFEEALGMLAEGMTERDLQEAILAAIKQRGSQPSFTPLICFGANAAIPHHHTGQARLQRGDAVIIDIGCEADYYASDITRTVAFGAPADPELEHVYHIVSQAHWAARERAKPGARGEEVDAAARDVIEKAGYGPWFVHRTGHGIGLSCHEPPYIVAGNSDPLQAGMCFSIEPGIYLPERFGVRIENIVAMMPQGVRSLNAEAARQLRIIG